MSKKEVIKGFAKLQNKAGNLKSAAIVAALAGLTAFCAPEATAEILPSPTSEFTHDVFVLSNPSDIPPVSGNYITLYNLDKTSNPWVATPKYYDFALSQTVYGPTEGNFGTIAYHVATVNGHTDVSANYINLYGNGENSLTYTKPITDTQNLNLTYNYTNTYGTGNGVLDYSMELDGFGEVPLTYNYSNDMREGENTYHLEKDLGAIGNLDIDVNYNPSELQERFVNHEDYGDLTGGVYKNNTPTVTYGGAISNAKASAVDAMAADIFHAYSPEYMGVFGYGLAINAKETLIHIKNAIDPNVNTWDDVAQLYQIGDSAEDILESFGLESFDDWTVLEFRALMNNNKTVDEYIQAKSDYNNLEELLSAYGLTDKKDFGVMHVMSVEDHLTFDEFAEAYEYTDFNEVLTSHGWTSASQITPNDIFLITHKFHSIPEAAAALGYEDSTIPANMGEISGGTFLSNSSMKGGAIYNDGTIDKISDSTFVSNLATGIDETVCNGGAISNTGGSITNGITNSTFVNNSTRGLGGAIYNSTGSTIGDITNSAFISNEVAYDTVQLVFNKGCGGAIANFGTINGISDSDFTSNAAIVGGAIFNIDGSITNGITNSKFISNSAVLGGAIYNILMDPQGDAYIGTISDSIFVSNSALSGGAISNSSGTIEGISNSVFFANSAIEDPELGGGGGGAIELAYASITNGISNSKFISNTAMMGGAIANISDESESPDKKIGAIKNSVFISNVATSDAGAIWNDGGTIKDEDGNGILNSTFVGNSSLDSGAGAIHNMDNGYIGKIKDSVFLDNSVIYQAGAGEKPIPAGAILNEGTMTDITGSYFINNSASSQPGSYVFAGAGALMNLDGGVMGKISDSVFIGNNINLAAAAEGIEGGAGALYNGGTMTDLTDSKFINNSVVLKLTDEVEYEEAEAVATSGAFVNLSMDDITNSVFINNVASAISEVEYGRVWVNSGAISNFEKIGTISESTFMNNSAYAASVGSAAFVYGGAIYNEGTIDSIEKSSFISNSAIAAITDSDTGSVGAYAGAIVNANSIGTINDSTFINNIASATSSGADAYAFSGAISNLYEIDSIENSIFVGNSASAAKTGSGEGEVYAFAGAIQNHDIISEIVNSVFINNSATATANAAENADVKAYAGAISNNSAMGNIISSTFMNNRAIASENGTAYAGAIYNEGTMGAIIDSNFINNYASNYAGAIYTNSDLTVAAVDDDVLFSGNKRGASFDADGNYIAGSGTSNAISFSEAKKLYLNAAENRTITFDDEIENGTLYINDPSTGFGTAGTIVLNNSINDAEVYMFDGTLKLDEDVSVGGIQVQGDSTLDSGNNGIQSYDNVALNGNTLNLIIDTNKESTDSLSLSDAIGTVYVSDINFIDVPDSGTIIQVLQNATEDTTLSVAQGLGEISEDIVVVVGPYLPSNNIKWSDDKMLKDTNVYHLEGDVDAVSYNGDGVTDALEFCNMSKTLIESHHEEVEGDVFKAMLDLAGDRSMSATSANETFTLTANYSDNPFAEGNLTINGVKSGDSISTLNANGHSVFTVGIDNVLSLNDVAIINASNSSANGGAIHNVGQTVVSVFMQDEGIPSADYMGAYCTGMPEDSDKALWLINHVVEPKIQTWDDVAREFEFGESAQDILDSFGLQSFDEWTYLEGYALFNECKSVDEFIAIATDYANLDQVLAALGLSSKEDFTWLHMLMVGNGFDSLDALAQELGFDSMDALLAYYEYSSVKQAPIDLLAFFETKAKSWEEFLIDDFEYPVPEGFVRGFGNLKLSGTTIFSGNKANGKYNDIRNDGIITLTDNAIVISNGGIDGNLNTGVINMNPGSLLQVNNNLESQTINMDGASIKLGSYKQNDNSTTYGYMNLIGLNVSENGANINAINNMVNTNHLGHLKLDGNLNVMADVDLAEETMDRLTAASVTGSGKINVVGMNLKTDMAQEKDNVSILFAEDNLKNSVAENTLNLDNNNPYQTTAYSPIYKYTATYSIEENGGYFNFARGGLNPTPDNFNPAVLATPAVQTANVIATQNIVNNYAFNFVDTAFLSRNGKLSSRYDNRYAIAENNIKDDLNTNNPLFIKPEHESVWFKPFVTFENVPLRNGPKVDSISYGSLIGYDSNPFYYKHGWEGVVTGYVGYTGASMHYSGVDDISNGGLMGATYSLYKGNFFNATTLNAGAMLDKVTTMYGKDNLTTLYAGVGNKTGYNFNFKEGLFTLQPSVLLSYTFANTFDYTNAAGVRIDSDPLHTIQISPGIKFFMNTKSGWQPYIGVNMMWNIMGNTHTRANGVQLPEMSVKPYVQYGIGLQKIMKDNFTAYGQAMIQNGGRNGISLTAGFKWALGRNKNKEKVQADGIKMVIKGE